MPSCLDEDVALYGSVARVVLQDDVSLASSAEASSQHRSVRSSLWPEGSRCRIARGRKMEPPVLTKGDELSKQFRG